MTRVIMATEIVLFVSFGIAATVALLMRSLDHDGLATLGTAGSQLCCLAIHAAETAQSPGPFVTDDLVEEFESNAARRRRAGIEISARYSNIAV